MTNLSDFPLKVTLLGGGNMGRAMLEGWLQGGLPVEKVRVIDPAPSDDLQRLADTHAFDLLSAATDISGAIECLVIAVKPQIAEAALAPLRDRLTQDSLAISLAAGKTLAFLSEQCAPAKVVRTIPNTPALVGRGATGAIAQSGMDPEQKRLADTLLSTVGLTVWVEEEAQIDAITALSGSGPAYLFHMVEAMARAGEALGLDAGTSKTLARATVEGAGELLHRSPDDAATLRQNVTSPGGTTAAALQLLMDDKNGLPPLMERVIKAARDRSEELA
ncbi:MAG: pyrroline-5-carboxylate reductase [Pseudomonadota bacterium]